MTTSNVNRIDPESVRKRSALTVVSQLPASLLRDEPAKVVDPGP
jgi:hypothetical protein